MRLISLLALLMLLMLLSLPLSAAEPAGEEEPTWEETLSEQSGGTDTPQAKDPEKEPEEAKLTVDDIPIRIDSAEVGDWALYRTAEGGTVRLTVVEKVDEVYDQYLTIRSEERRSDRKKRPRTSENRISVADSIAELRELGPDDYIVPAEVLVSGRKLKGIVVNFVNDDGNLWKQSYFSDRVPIHGLIRGVVIENRKRVVSLSLEDFGYADDED